MWYNLKKLIYMQELKPRLEELNNQILRGLDWLFSKLGTHSVANRGDALAPSFVPSRSRRALAINK